MNYINKDTNTSNMLSFAEQAKNLISSYRKVIFEDIYIPDVTKQRQITELYLQLKSITDPVH